MEKERKQEIKQKMMDISTLIEQGNNPKEMTVSSINYYQDFNFTGSGLAENNIFVAKVQNSKSNTITYEIYSERTSTLIATVDEKGKLYFTPEYIDLLRQINEAYLESLNLEDLDFELPEELSENDMIMQKQEMEQEKTNERETSSKKEEKPEKQEEKEKQSELSEEAKKDEIAKQKGIPSHDVLFVKENSNLYKDHPELEPNLYFYKGADGVVRAEYVDKDGNAQPSKYFEDSQTSLRQETVSLGKNGEPVTKSVPYQVMRTKGLNNVDKDIRDIRMTINIDTYGYLDIEEARQGKNGEWLSHDVELKGRSYNSYAVNKATSIRSREADPDKQTESYEKAEDSEIASEDGIDYTEMYLVKHAEEIIQNLINEGYQKPEAVSIFNYMIGEEHLRLNEAKDRVNKEIEQKYTKREKDIQRNDEEGSTPQRSSGGRDRGEEAYEKRYNRE